MPENNKVRFYARSIFYPSLMENRSVVFLNVMF